MYSQVNGACRLTVLSKERGYFREKSFCFDCTVMVYFVAGFKDEWISLLRWIHDESISYSRLELLHTF